MTDPNPKRSVAATNAIRQSKRLGFGADAGGSVFFGGLRQRAAPASGDIRLTTTFAADPVAIEMHAGTIVEITANALLVFARDSILSGLRMSDGASQRQLGKVSAAEDGRLTPFRGAKSGVLADGLRRTRVTGTTVRARATILPPTNRNVFIAAEQRRGVEYLGLGEATDPVIQLAVQTAVDAALRSRLKDPEPEEVSAAKIGKG